LGLFGESGTAVDNLGGTFGVPASGGGEVAVVDGEECASGERCGDSDSRSLILDSCVNRVNHRQV
jgi:hypothetical protein